eukprot:TRINITY_DN990_c0_g3_i1.p1 TRINITY_DN990_c0_g3~~TRINITY_DN990_c0_g3_i1.p1  ORF type:complete len:524 (+),score=116.11 TRINITY_DN990_c0_g3_i1:167-1738(+)
MSSSSTSFSESSASSSIGLKRKGKTNSNRGKIQKRNTKQRKYVNYLKKLQELRNNSGLTSSSYSYSPSSLLWAPFKLLGNALMWPFKSATNNQKEDNDESAENETIDNDNNENSITNDSNINNSNEVIKESETAMTDSVSIVSRTTTTTTTSTQPSTTRSRKVTINAIRFIRRRYLFSYYNGGSVRRLLSKQWMRQAVRWDLLGVGMSKLWGRLNSRPLPMLLRKPVYSLWGIAFKCNMQEVPQPLHTYPTLADFFARELKEGARPIADFGMASPVDGRVLACGEVVGDQVEQIKGKTYSLTHFLGAPVETLRKSNTEGKPTKLYHCIIYLSPGDYHRIHFPSDCNIKTRRHFPGTLFPVNPPFLKIIPWLFALNERVVLMGGWNGGYQNGADEQTNDHFFSLTAVGAYNVGSISISFDSTVKTNQLTRDYTCPNLQYFSWGGVGSYAYERDYTILPPSPMANETEHIITSDSSLPPGVNARKGAELGQFHFGSTVVLIFECEEFDFTVKAGDYVQMGQLIGK